MPTVKSVIHQKLLLCSPLNIPWSFYSSLGKNKEALFIFHKECSRLLPHTVSAPFPGLWDD